MTDAPTDSSAAELADRYGRPAPWRRTAVVLASGLVGVLALTWLAWTTLFHATPDASSDLVSFEVVSDNAVTARVDVVLRGTPDATCEVRAIAADHTVVGEASFVPTDGRNEVQFRTERRASAVEDVGCTTPDQHRPR
ncbi:MAG: DUF4307 domain-containing protein [Nocardioides sp.]